MLKEFCAENYTHVQAALEQGAKRIELCDNLAVGGTTPSYGVVQATVDLVRIYQAEVRVMIRPRAGDFVYSPQEVKMMLADMAQLRPLAVDGFVFGALKGNWLDEAALDQLMAASQGKAVTFHMAFDQLAKDRQLAAIDYLADLGVQTILTHGSQASNPIEANLSHLKTLVDYAQGRLEILPGGGVHWENADWIAKELGVKALHGTKIVRI